MLRSPVDRLAGEPDRHVASGARFPRDMDRADPRYVEAIQRTLAGVGPAADGVLKPHWMEGGDDENDAVRRRRGRDPGFRHEGARAPMKVIGLLAAAY